MISDNLPQLRRNHRFGDFRNRISAKRSPVLSKMALGGAVGTRPQYVALSG
jgi:hypothetical protein